MTSPTNYPHINGIHIGFCRQTGSVEVAIDPKKSVLLHASLWPFTEKMALEGRFYMHERDGRREFVSARVSTRNNISFVLGVTFPQYLTTSWVGGYSNWNHFKVTPTIGVSWGWYF